MVNCLMSKLIETYSFIWILALLVVMIVLKNVEQLPYGE